MDVVLFARSAAWQGRVDHWLGTAASVRRLHPSLLVAGDAPPALPGTQLLLALSAIDTAMLRALQRLWAAEEGPRCTLLSLRGSAVEDRLRQLAGVPATLRAGLCGRPLQGLSISALLALERQAAASAQRPAADQKL
ncbi:hypothetical protein [Aquabacterium sp.]|uniref:hypothetical protein n=1 Tax=Aquabacterium sp. TaxID=1872578 RepID=UPI003784C2DD